MWVKVHRVGNRQASVIERAVVSAIGAGIVHQEQVAIVSVTVASPLVPEDPEAMPSVGAALTAARPVPAARVAPRAWAPAVAVAALEGADGGGRQSHA